MSNPTESTPTPLKGREIIVAVCGGIAAYKVAEVVSGLVQLGAGVTVCMTEAAQKFVTPLTFQALSGRPVRTDAFALGAEAALDTQHIKLTDSNKLSLKVVLQPHRQASREGSIEIGGVSLWEVGHCGGSLAQTR